MARKPLKDEDKDVKTMTKMTGEDKTQQFILKILQHRQKCHVKYVYILYYHTTLHMSSSSGSFINTKFQFYTNHFSAQIKSQASHNSCWQDHTLPKYQHLHAKL